MVEDKKKYVEKGTDRNRIKENERVKVRDYSDPNKLKWRLAIVLKQLGKRHFRCQLESGYVRKFHIDQMIKADSIEDAP